MQSGSTPSVGQSGPPAFVLLALTAFVISLVWTIPLQWLVIRRMVTEIRPGRLAGHAALATLASGIAGGVPVLLTCGLLANVAFAAGVSTAWVQRVFILVLRPEWPQAAFLVGWLGLAWLATSAAEAVILKRLWRGAGIRRAPWSVAWRANGIGYLGVAVLAVLLLRNP